MNKTVLILFIILFSDKCFSQVQKFPDGLYLNFIQFKNRTPVFDADLKVIHRTQGDIGFNGGNDYELTSDIDSLNKKFLKKTVFAYVKHDSIFLNCMRFGLGTWYSLALTQGTFIAFKGAMSYDKANEEVGMYGAMFGAIGGGIAGANAAKKRYLYVFSVRTGNAKPLKKEYLVERLKESQSLLDKYNNEKDQNSDSTLTKYIELLNDVIPIDSSAPAIVK